MLENCKTLNLATGLAASLSQKKAFQSVTSLSDKSLFSRPNLFLTQLLLLSGDVELNPGPPTKYPCGECSRPCKKNQPAILCDNCESWYHQKCLQMNTAIFEALGDCSFTWICCNCGIPNFSSNIFDQSTSLESSNPFSSLQNLSDQSPQLPFRPPQTSTPIRPNRNSHENTRNRPEQLPKEKTKTKSSQSKNNQKDAKHLPLKTLVINLQSINNKKRSL